MTRKSNQYYGVKYASGLLLLITNYALLITFSSCGVSKQIAKQAQQTVLADSLLATAHIGICVYDATDGKYLYNYQGNKYFIPASNTKIATCYAAMKYLGDSLVGLRYQRYGDSGIKLIPTGDPTLLHEDFVTQPVFNFLQRENGHLCLSIKNWEENPLGAGWSWDDYNDDYMVERSAIPVYGNIVKFHLLKIIDQGAGLWGMPHYSFQTIPSSFEKNISLSSDDDSLRVTINGTKYTYSPLLFGLKRNMSDNNFIIIPSLKEFSDITIPFSTNDKNLVPTLLEDTLHKQIGTVLPILYSLVYGPIQIIHSQPTDSLLKIMMHRSDNFYAEQSLLMVGNEHIGVMNDAKIIDTLLTTDYAAMPQRPQWVDGSGLSRYNLFTPQDFVFILNKIRNEFSWNRITTIFSTGGDGTLGSYYKGLKGKIFAKTGSLSNNIALSGYLSPKKTKTLFSLCSSTTIR